MDTREEILMRMKSKKVNINNKIDKVVYKKEKVKCSKYTNIITSVFLSIIFLLSSLIFVKVSKENELLYKEYVLTNSMSFTNFNTVYEDYFGAVAPSIKTDEFVFNSELVFTSIENLGDIEIIHLTSSVISTISGGIVVYIGEKENFGNTVIVQSNDGNNVWYGNLENISLTLYDYVEKGEIIGEAINKELYITIKNGNEIISYETYKD